MTINRRDLLASAGAGGLLGAAGLVLGPLPKAVAAPNDPIHRSAVIDRAWNWYNRNIQYNKNDTATGPDGTYSWRCDCSGFVSMALKLGPTGRGCPNTTALATETYSFRLLRSSLAAGDFLVDPGVHVVLFHKWANDEHTRIVIFEEANKDEDMNHYECALSKYASYEARRANNIRD